MNGFKIHKGCWDKLFPYQKEGVLWFWDLFKKNTGGILGDDMGYVCILYCQEYITNKIINITRLLLTKFNIEIFANNIYLKILCLLVIL